MAGFTTFPLPDRIDNHAPPEGVTNAAYLNAVTTFAETKLDLIGGCFFTNVAPTAPDGVDGQKWHNSVTSLIHTKTAGAWDAGVTFGADAYLTWVARGFTFNGGNTVQDWDDSHKGDTGTSFDMAVATTEPADVDKVENTAYFVCGTPTPTSSATAGGRTITAAELLTNIYVRDCAGAGRTDTLPTAALLVAAMPGDTRRVGEMVTCLIVNGSDAAETITIAAGAGGSFDPNQIAASRIIPQNASKRVHIRLTNIGSGTETYRVYL